VGAAFELRKADPLGQRLELAPTPLFTIGQLERAPGRETHMAIEVVVETRIRWLLVILVFSLVATAGVYSFALVGEIRSPGASTPAKESASSPWTCARADADCHATVSTTTAGEGR